MGRVKYSQFEDRIDVPELCNAIGFNPEYEDARGNLVGYCLFPDNHSNGDTTGKFAIHPDKKLYNCYVCGGGSLLSLVMELYSWDSETAENYLRQFAGDARDDVDFVDDFLQAFANDAEKRVESLPYFNPRVLAKWDYAFEYGTSVGLNMDVIEDYNVLYAPEYTKPSPPKGKFADEPNYVGPAVIWPHFWHGRLVGWQARMLGCTKCWHDHGPGMLCCDDTGKDCDCTAEFEPRPEWVGKWINTVDLPKDSTLYGWHNVRTGNKVYVVESAKTVLKLAQLGLDAVGTFGSNANDAQLRLLRRFQHGIVLCPDNDKAGHKWFTHLYDYLRPYVPLEGVAPVDGAKGDLADLSDDEAKDHLAEYTVDLNLPHM